MSTATLPTRQRRKDIRPQQLLDAALELFVEKGFSATRSEDLAQRAGVAKGTLYLYYPSKEDLFKEVVRQNLSKLITEGIELIGSFEGPTAELLSMLIATWWERVGDAPAGGIHKIMLAEARNFPELASFYADEVIVPANTLFRRVVQRGIDRGEFRPVPVDDTAHALMAPTLFFLLHRHSLAACPAAGIDIDHARALQTHVDLMLRGLLPRPPLGTGEDPR